MTLDLAKRDPHYGDTMGEFIQKVAAELPYDAVGLWQIVPRGINTYELAGEDLIEFIRRCIWSLLNSGAIPVEGGGQSNYDWIELTEFGDSCDQIVEGVIQKWLEHKDEEYFLFDIWFALPFPEVLRKGQCL